jgi:elongation factor G
MSFPFQHLRNIGIIAHIDAGKTTLTERILYYCGRTHRMGTVDEGNTVTDWMDQERERGITIVAAAVSADWRGHRINLIDTPGHIDFTAEVQRALRVLDGGIVVFDAVQGVEPQSETVWRQADRYRVPRICFINKMDRVGANFERACESIRQRLGANAVAVQLPWGSEGDFAGVIDLIRMEAMRWPDALGMDVEHVEIPPAYQQAAAEARARLVEQASECDDDLLGLYLEGREPEAELLRTALRRATLANRVYPVFCGAALRNKGVQPVLDAIVDFLPSPGDVGPVQGADPRSGEPVSRASDAPLSALAFKVACDPYSGHLTYLRVYSGRLSNGQAIYNATRDRNERVGRLVRLYADRREELDEIAAGDIAAALGMKGVFTGDTLCARDHPIVLEPIAFPEPVIQVAVEPRSAADQERMSLALKALAEEDPTFRVRSDEITGETLIAGMGELHLEVLLERARREHHVQLRAGRPRVAYKETITRAAPRVEGRHVRQTGGHGQYGHVVLSLTPGAPGSGIVFENAITGGIIPGQFIPAIEAGVRAAAQAGALGGYPVADIRVRLEDGSFHPVDSSEPAFHTAAMQAFRRGLELGRSTLLEPLARLEVVAPEEFLGDVLGLLSARRCQITGTESRPGGTAVVRGEAPLSEMFGYATEIRSATQGRGAFSLEPSHYAPLDPAQARKVLGLA